MTSIFRRTLWVGAIVGLALPVHAAQGVLLVQQMTMGGSVRTTQIQIEPQRMRAEVADQDGKTQVVIFDSAKQVMWVVDASRKSYMEMTKADVERMGSQMSAAMAAMQEQLKNLPPAQRAKIEAMMKGRGMAQAAVPTEYRRAGTDKAGRWTCARYEGFENGQKTSEVCTVQPKELGFTAADFAVTREMAEFFRRLAPNASVFAVGTSDAQGFSGVPVRSVIGSGADQIVTEIVDARRDTFPDALFAVPEGFARQALPGAPGR